MNQAKNSHKRKFSTSSTSEIATATTTTSCTDMADLKELLSEQRHELVSAQTLEADLDFACDLQMQEAINASLALLPSSSSSISELSSSFVGSDEGFSFASRFVEEIDRFEQEYNDGELSEAEVRNTRDDLDRRIHDQKFASFIQRVPEDEWIVKGDNYERPYREGCFREEEVKDSFRVYFKGLVSEESVRDSSVVVAAIGVAICDSKDNLLFELRKPFVNEDDDEMLLMSGGVEVGIRALVEGLNAAIALDLKRIDCLCDDRLIHDYLMERYLPTTLKISKLVTDVSLLRKKFTTFTLSFVALKDLKFAFKLAREAIVSQIAWQSETGRGKKLMETCIICFENTVVDKMFTVDGFFHRFCFSCMKKHAEVKLLSEVMVKCPHENCEIVVNIDNLGEFMDPKMVEVISQRKKEASIPVTEKVYCPYPKCSALMSRKEVSDYTKSVVAGSEQSGARKCRKCHGFFCINCKIPWHNDMTCFDYKRSNPHHSVEDAKLVALASKKLWRLCVKCKHMIELAQGSYHIYCRCGYEFCYTCGAEWKNKKPTCSCPLWTECNLYNNRRVEDL